jgi:hypothetical protein
MAAKPGQITVRFAYSRHVWPRHIHGSVALQFSPALSFQFTSVAKWPTSDDYTLAIENAVRDVLTARDALAQTSCKLLSVDWDTEASCEFGFAAAARAATLAAFEV